MSYKTYIPDADAWKHHFQQMAEGKMDHVAPFYRLSKQPKNPDPATLSVKLVTPSAQVAEQAKEELKREESESKKRPSTTARKPPSKRTKSKLLKDPEPDFFSD